jgi:hypothetical protein
MPQSRAIRDGVFVLCVLAVAVAAGAQPPPPTGPAADPPRIVKRAIQPDGTVELTYSDGTTRKTPLEGTAATGGSPSADAASPVAPPEWLKDAATNQLFLQAMGDYYRYRSSGLQHRSRVFEWQLFSSKVIFATVLMLVGAGMVFAAIQFHAGMRRAPGEEALDVTEVNLSATSVKVSSPVLGVIILVISLAFFYLYLVYVYPISEIL